MLSKLFIVLTAVAVGVNAQVSNSSSAAAPTASTAAGTSLDACTLQCLTTAASLDGCTSYTDLTCVCTNAQFQADARLCIQTYCGSTDLAAVSALQGLECSALTLSATASATASLIPFTSVASGASGSVTGSAAASGVTSASAASAASGSGSSGASSNGAVTASSPASATTAESSSTAVSSAGSLVANSGVAAIMAMLAGFLAL